MEAFKTVRIGKYRLGGGMGSWAQSIERGVEPGEVRFIDGVLMYAYSVYPRFFRPATVNWTPVDSDKNTPEGLRKWLAK